MPVQPETFKDFLDLWNAYEGLAKHFNTLILNYRLQVFSGFGVLSILGASALRLRQPPETIDLFRPEEEYEAKEFLYLSKVNAFRSFVSGILALLLFLFGLLDIFYYSKLLEGAVDAILQLEDCKVYILSSTVQPNLCKYDVGVSTLIEQRVGGVYPGIVYFVYFSLFMISAVSSMYFYRSSKILEERARNLVS